MRRRRSHVLLALGGAVSGVSAAGLGAALLVLLLAPPPAPPSCTGGGPASIVLGPPGEGAVVGATEYGGPGDPSSGVVGARGDSLLAHPDSYAELGGLTWDTATAMGGLSYLTPLQVSWGRHSAIAYKRDFGLGGAPVDGRPRVIDLWWQFAGRLGIPYEHGLWSGPVRVARAPGTGSGNITGGVAAPPAAGAGMSDGCPAEDPGSVPVTAGLRARLLADGLAAAPAGAPQAVKAIIAAGNQIVGKPYRYGAAHGTPLSEVAAAYDCSSSVEHLLYGARLIPVTYGGPSGELEFFGAPGPGRWVTLYASAGHVYMYVAGLRWDTHDAAGAGDGSTGIGWHPLVRSAAGFVPRHPVGL